MDFAKWCHVRVFGIHLCTSFDCSKTLSRFHAEQAKRFLQNYRIVKLSSFYPHRRTKPQRTTYLGQEGTAESKKKNIKFFN